MSLQQLVQESFDAFEHYSQNTKIVLLHSQSRFRSMVVAKMLNTCTKPVYYYSMGPYDVNVVSFLAGFAHDLAEQHPTFGRHLNQLGIETYAHATQEFPDALLLDLEELSNEPYLLILDEYDASERANDVQEFLEKVLLNLPDNCQVVINSRTLPRLTWVALMAQHKAIILNDSELIQYDTRTKCVKERLHPLTFRHLVRV